MPRQFGVPEAVSNTYTDLVLHGQPTRDWLAFIHPLFAAMSAPPYGNATNFYRTPPAMPLPPLELDAYRGTYANDYFGDVTMRVQDGELVMLLGPDASPYPLQHWNR